MDVVPLGRRRRGTFAIRGKSRTHRRSPARRLHQPRTASNSSSSACRNSTHRPDAVRMNGFAAAPDRSFGAGAAAGAAGEAAAVDGNGELYQFLALIRLRDGSPLMDSRGRITSHLSGLFYRVTRLIADYGIQLVFVMDGKPPSLKHAEIERRRTVKQKYETEHAAALAAGDLAKAYSKSTMTSRLTRAMVDEAVELLHLLGLPVVQALSEGEAQASHMAEAGAVWAAGS